MADHIRFTVTDAREGTLFMAVEASSKVASAVSHVALSPAALQELAGEIQEFLQNDDLEAYWESDIPGLGLAPCITMKWIPDADPEYVLLDLYMELDDGGDFSRHASSFYIHCSRLQLQAFSAELASPDLLAPGSVISLSGI